jgi:hypothetical protein
MEATGIKPAGYIKTSAAHVGTLVAIGLMAYAVADISHEAIGHGGACLIGGGKITLLTSIYFRSKVHSFITDVFGPLGNLAAGLMVWAFLQRKHKFKLYTQLLLMDIMTFNLCWFSWMCFYAGLTGKGDLSLDISGATAFLCWRIFLIIIGIIFYLFFFKLIIRITQKYFDDFKYTLSKRQLRQLYSIPYYAAGIGALIAVSFFRPYSASNYMEAITFVMYLPVLFIPGRLKDLSQKQQSETSNLNQYFSTGQQRKFILWGILLFALFCATMGRGMRF